MGSSRVHPGHQSFRLLTDVPSKRCPAGVRIRIPRAKTPSKSASGPSQRARAPEADRRPTPPGRAKTASTAFSAACWTEKAAS